MFDRVGLGALALLSASCVTPSDSLGSRSEAVIGGAIDSADVAVVAIRQKSTGTLCSGTLVSPAIVITAAHCVFHVAAEDLEILVGADVTAPDQTVAAASTAVYPTYAGEAEGLTGGVDLGAIYLAQSLGVTPIPTRTTTKDADLAGQSVMLVGFGIASTLDSSGAGTRRSVSVTVTKVCSRLLSLGDENGNECNGDSGGAVLLGGSLVAVISSGKLDCSAPSNQTRLDAHADWVAAVLAGNGAAACPTCVMPDPSCQALVEGQPVMADAGVAPPDATPAADSGGGGCQWTGGGDVSGAFPAALAALFAAGVSRRQRRSRR